jgi:predicted permease
MSTLVDGLRILLAPVRGRELRQALRALTATPWFTPTLVAVIALTTTLSATVFAIVDGVLFRPLPYPEPDRLFTASSRRATGRGGGVFKHDEIGAWRAALPDVAIAAFQVPGDAGTLGDGRRYAAVAVDDAFFDVIGQRPIAGGFAPDDFRPGNNRAVAIISHRLWQRVFDGRTDVIGQVLPLAGGVDQLGRPIARPVVVGVLPRDFVFPSGNELVDVIRPVALTAAERAGRNESALVGLVRLPSGASLEAVQQALDAATLAAQPPGDQRPIVGAPLRSVTNLGFAYARSFRTLTWVAVLLVLVACLGVASLAAARSRQRERTVVVRRALGATSWHLVRDHVLELAPVVCAAAALGFLCAPAALAATLSFLPMDTPFVVAPAIDGRVVVVVASLTLTVIAASAAAALVTVRRVRQIASPTAHVTRRFARFGRALIALQTGLAFVLTLAGLLTMTGAWRVWQVDPGYDRDHLAIVEVNAKAADFEQARRHLADMTDQLSTLPGVVSAGMFGAPMLQRGWGVATARPAPDAEPIELQQISVGGALLETLEVRPVQGRLPTRDEIDRGDDVVLLSTRAVRSLWQDQPVVGRTLWLSQQRAVRIIGVVPELQFSSLGDIQHEAGQIYLTGAGRRASSFVLRTAGPPQTVLASARRLVESRSAELDLIRAVTMRQALAESISSQRFAAWAYGGVAASALAIVGVATLGLVAMITSLRTRELGVRRALGASRRSVIGLLLREQVSSVTIGLVGGGIGAAWSVETLRRSLYGTTPGDPSIWAATAVVMIVTASAGVLIPAVRVSRVDPIQVLRAD